MKSWLSLAVICAALSQVKASFLNSPSTAVYWGQNSGGGFDTQKSLSEYCDDSADVILMSFVLNFRDGSLPELNLSNACTGPNFPGTSLLNCPSIGDDIKKCQSKGKTILLSLGGAAGSYGFSNDRDASDFADTLWKTFGGGKSDTRPFGNAIVDGFDLDIEGGGSTGYTAMVKQLRSNFKKDSSRKYYVTAAPQCPYPDAMLGPVLENADFDAVFVQFYNNYCSVSSGSFNFETWDNWAKRTSKKSDVKIFLGIPGSSSAAGSGYVPYSSLESVVQGVHSTYSSFGGVSIWDASASFSNSEQAPNYQKSISRLVTGLKRGGSPTTTTTTTTTTTVASTETHTTKTTTSTKTSSTSIPEPTSTEPAKNCVKEGESCSGAFACAGTSYATCVDNKWLLRSCPKGLVCLPTTDGSSVYCAQGKASTCSKKEPSLGAGSSSAKAYKSSNVNAQFSLDGASHGNFNATLNVRAMSRHAFKEKVNVQFKVSSGTKVTDVSEGSVSQNGNKVTIKFHNPNNESMSVIIGLKGKLPRKDAFVGPAMNSMKFY